MRRSIITAFAIAVAVVCLGKMVYHFQSAFTTGFFDYYMPMLGIVMAVCAIYLATQRSLPNGIGARPLAILTIIAALIKIITDWADPFDDFLLSLPILIIGIYVLRGRAGTK